MLRHYILPTMNLQTNAFGFELNILGMKGSIYDYCVNTCPHASITTVASFS